MAPDALLERIVLNPKVMLGKPVIRGTRLTVEHILGLLSQGMTIDEIVDEYTGITREDVLACLAYASRSLADVTYFPTLVETE